MSDDSIPEDDSAPDIEIDADPTEANSAGRSTMPHASIDWMAGFDEGRQRGAAEMLDALGGALAEVGVPEDVTKVIVARVRKRADKPDDR
jgi:hypothetical protein